jgi:hypothetical protein
MPSSNPEHRKWYGLGAWKKRQRLQMQAEPTCRRCAEVGVVRAAVIADHINPNWVTWDQFLGAELASLCRACHGRKRQEERLGYRLDIDESGLPRDKRHPTFLSSLREHNRFSEHAVPIFSTGGRVKCLNTARGTLYCWAGGTLVILLHMELSRTAVVEI